MTEALLAALLDAIVAWARSRISASLAPLRVGAQLPPRQVAALLVDTVRSARRAAWAAQVLYLESQLDEPVWVPPIPGYAEAAIERAVREVPGVLESDAGVEHLVDTMERHVRAAARQTMVAAVEDAPEGVETVERIDRATLERNLADLLDGRETARDIAEREAERPRTGGGFGDAMARALMDVSSRVEEAIREARMHEATAGMSEAERLIAAVPASARTTLRGERILRPFAWARVCHPSLNGPCGFCQLLAARGPVYESAQTAGVGADAYHDNCRCTAVPVFTSREWEGKEAAEAYAAVYAQVVTAANLSGADARRAMDSYARGERKRNRKRIA